MGRQRTGRIGVWICVLFILGRFAQAGACTGPVCYFLYDGTVYRVDIAGRGITIAGSLHRTAPELDIAPDGLVWGRGSLTSIAALDPERSERVAEIDLPERPYAQIITPAAVLYAAHNTLTRQGFSMSAVDLSAGSVKARIRGIQGLVTGLAQDDRYVYVAALGVRRPDFLYLYRINLRTHNLEELYRVPKTEYCWELTVHEDRLYVTYVRGSKGEGPPLIEVMELQSAKIAEGWGPSGLGPISRFTEGLSFDNGSAYAPVLFSDGGVGLAVFDPRSGALRRVLAVSPAPCRVVGFHDGCFVFAVDAHSAGASPSLSFYDIGQEKALCSVPIPNQVAKEAPQ